MQTIRVPYTVDPDGHKTLTAVRRVQSAAVRTAYANAARLVDGRQVFSTETELRDLVKARFGTAVLDFWALHCANRIGLAKRRQVPDGKMIFGGRKDFLRRNDGLIDDGEWAAMRLLPFVSYGDSQKAFGNQNIHLLSETEMKLRLARHIDDSERIAKAKDKAEAGNGDYKAPPKRLVVTSVTLQLQCMTGNAGKIIRQLVAICASPDQKDRINVTYSIDAGAVSITFDPDDLPDHPERRRPLEARKGRAIGIDLNPEAIGIAAVENTTNPEVLEETCLLEYALVQLPRRSGISSETIRETLAATCDRVIGLARKHRADTIVLEKGLGELRSRGRNRVLNGMINHWARTVFLHMLARKARLAGITVIEIWGGYSTTIGNLAFEAPDACASAAEIGRRGIARASGLKEALPAMAPEVCLGRWKDQELPKEVSDDLAQALSWGELHRKIKRAKLGVRRPHPESRLETGGLAVHRLRLRHRPGWIFRPPLPAVEAVA